ncbi:BTAD domain-containing putative transcriptional regulator [Nonomuraea sp. NPDC050790]|uniref:BTAD domain-containing putative transcriptional regulator n=1 Tax=Nonomuraea sp. NPDC050790 TaxID=3364371 RepID=UPI00379C2594
MRYRILGTTEVAGEQVNGDGLRALLAALLLEAGRPVSAERLLEVVYGGEGAAPNALQSQISRLRKLVPVERVAPGYLVRVDPEEVDAHRFARLVAEGRRAGRTPEAVRLLGEALALWRGEALAGLPGLDGHRERLAGLRAEAVENRIEAELALKAEPARLIEELRTLVAATPLRERPRELLIRALAGGGRQVEALECFEDYRRLLAEELGTSPSPELRTLHVAVLRGEHTQRPLTAMTRPRRQVSTFVGREEELAGLRALLRGHRLVTLVGPGGSGKTRLAAEAVSGQIGQRVCFAELAPAAGVRQAVLGALGGALSPSGDPVALLAGESLLLVLDNCEHLIEEAAALTDRLLAGAPGVRVLATSREPLGLDGEVILPVRPLALPAEDAVLAEALDSPAVSLLVDRARAADPHFAATEAVVRICRALDGLPLAIELAAARLRALSAEDLAERLEERLGDRLDLLGSGPRGGQARHRTLRAVVSWSWELLSAAEQRLAARLSAFPSGASLKAAEEVCGATPALLAALVDKSIVQAGQGRYRMLETVRAFCAEHLVDGEADAVHLAHAEFFAELAVRAEPYLRNHRQAGAMAELAAEHDNLHAALRWAIATGRPGTALRMTAALWLYWWQRGFGQEASQLTAAALALPGAEECGADYVMSVLQVASASNPRGRLRPLLERAERLAEQLGPVPEYPLIQMVRPYPAVAEGDYDALVPSLLTATTSSQPWSRGFAHLVLALVRLGAGNQVNQATEHLTSALTAFRLAGDSWGAAQALLQTAEIAGWRGEHERELALTEEAMALTAVFGEAEDTGFVLAQRGAAKAKAGDLAGAKADLERAVELTRSRKGPEVMAAARYVQADVARLEGDGARAAALYREALTGCGHTLWVGEEELRARIFIGLGQVTGDEGLFREAFDILMRTLDVPAAAGAVEGVAALALAEGAAERAATLLGAARALRGLPGFEAAGTEAEARRLLGTVAYERAHRCGAGMDREDIAALMSARRAGAVSAAAHR